MAIFPTITYFNVKHTIDGGFFNGSITYQDEDITVAFNGGTTDSITAYRASYNSPFNSITGRFSSNMELNRFEIRVTPMSPATGYSDDYGPGIGNLAYFTQGISANTLTNFSISITPEVFIGSSTNTYRVCLMAQSSIDHS